MENEINNIFVSTSENIPNIKQNGIYIVPTSKQKGVTPKHLTSVIETNELVGGKQKQVKSNKKQLEESDDINDLDSGSESDVESENASDSDTESDQFDDDDQTEKEKTVKNMTKIPNEKEKLDEDVESDDEEENNEENNENEHDENEEIIEEEKEEEKNEDEKKESKIKESNIETDDDEEKESTSNEPCLYKIDTLIDQSLNQPATKVDSADRVTDRQLTYYEKIRILEDRTKQISLNSKIMLKLDKNSKNLSSYELAIKELNNMTCPFIIKRVLPNNCYELWKLKEMIISDDLNIMVGQIHESFDKNKNEYAF